MVSKFLKKVRHYHSALGWAGVGAFLWAKFTRSRPLYKVTAPGMEHPVFIRIGSTDLSVFKQVLVECHYDFKVPQAPKVIIDGGANIGLSAVYFANRYPDALIVAVEPEESNFRVLEKNVAPYSKIRPLKAAIWKENTSIQLVNPEGGNHGFQTVEKTTAAPVAKVEAQTVDGIMRGAGVDHVDILKLDIEGAELEVLQHSAGWMDKVGVVMVELHEHLRKGCEEAFRTATQDFVDEQHLGETVARFRVPVSGTARRPVPA